MKNIISAIAVLLVFATTPGAFAEDQKTETRQVSPFTAIEMRGAAKVFVTVGAAQSVTIEADASVIDNITTEVRDNTLIIDRKEHWWKEWQNGHVTVRIAVPKLAAFGLAGAGDIAITGLNGGATAFTISGSGNVRASGALERESIAVNGAGTVDFAALPVNEATVAVNGTGTVNIAPRHALTAVVNGVGTIIYDGSPEHLVTSINGIGSIKQKQPK